MLVCKDLTEIESDDCLLLIKVSKDFFVSYANYEMTFGFEKRPLPRSVMSQRNCSEAHCSGDIFLFLVVGGVNRLVGKLADVGRLTNIGEISLANRKLWAIKNIIDNIKTGHNFKIDC